MSSSSSMWRGWTAAALAVIAAAVAVMHGPLPARAAEGDGGSDCFSAVFAFGDGAFDTGSMSNVFPSMLPYDYPPYGSTHFGRPSGRFSDGRLVLDFIAEALGLPAPYSYAATVASDFATGVSFASAFATIGKVSTGQDAGPNMFLNPFALNVQLEHYHEFRRTTAEVAAKARKTAAALRDSSDGAALTAETAAAARLPAEFNGGLYLLSIGGHDIINAYNKNSTADQIRSKFSALIASYRLVVRALAKSGVKNIVVFDVEPLGCQPFLLTLLPHEEQDLDVKGCLIATNALVQDFNRMLKVEVRKWRSEFKKNVVLLSQYDIKIDMLKDDAAGFARTNVACCGVPASPYNVLSTVPCGGTALPDPATGKLVEASACEEPASHVYWDGFYTTEAANKYVAEKMLTGAYFDVSFDSLISCVKPPL